MKRTLSDIGWGLASVLGVGSLTWWWEQHFSAQAAWVLAWGLIQAWEWLTPWGRRGQSGGSLAGRVSASCRSLMYSWPGFTLLNAGFAWDAPLAAGLVQVLVSGLKWNAGRGPASGEGLSSSWREALAQIMMVGVSAVIVWTAVQTWAFPRIGDRQGDYYNLLARGFSKGTLAVDMEVKPELRNAPNPWNPAERPPNSAPADITYYDGRFYLYFGVVPTVLLIWPFQLLTGCDLPQVYSMIFFCLGAYWLWGRLWLRFLREEFPGAGIVTAVAGMGWLGLAGGLLALARRGNLWELPIAAGQFFMAAMLFAAYVAMKNPQARGWLILAGTALGLAVGSRPTLALAGGSLVVMVLVVAGRPWRGWPWLGRVAVSAAWAGVPLAVLMAGLLVYNHQRFGDPLEFGLNYQLTAVYEAKATHFSPSFVPYNLELYFLSSPSWGRYFPFVHPVEGLPSQPEGYYGYEYVYGVLVTHPVIWLALPVLVWGMWPGAWRNGRPGPFVALVAAGTLSLSAVMLAFNTAAARYMADFLPGWILLGLTGWAGLENRLGARAWGRRLAQSVMTLGTAYGLVVAYGAGAEVHAIFKQFNPTGYTRVARLLNAPVVWWENWRGVPAGRVDMTVTFPAQSGDIYEPLLVTGSSYNKDRVEVNYQVPGRIRLMYWPSSHAPVFTKEIAIEPGRPYRLSIETGALYPPEEHPYFDGWTRYDVLACKRWVRLEFDGEVVLEQMAYSHNAAPELLQFGEEASFGRRFSGTLESIRRQPQPKRLSLLPAEGDLGLRIWLPDAPQGRPQPLVSVGKSGEADLITVRMAEANSMVFGFERWGAGFWESRPFPVPADRVVDLRLRFDSRLPVLTGTPRECLRRGVALWIDGQPEVWWSLGEPPKLREPVLIGINAIDSTVPQEFFEGRVLDCQAMPVTNQWHPGPFQAVKLLLASVPNAIPGPLLATGETGRADLLSLQWLPGGRARLEYDHWGQGSSVSPEFEWSPEKAHLLEIEAPALAALDRQGGATGRGWLRVRLDGVLRWETEVNYHVASAGSLRVCRNDAGSSTAGGTWPGVVLDLVQVPLP